MTVLTGFILLCIATLLNGVAFALTIEEDFAGPSTMRYWFFAVVGSITTAWLAILLMVAE